MTQKRDERLMGHVPRNGASEHQLARIRVEMYSECGGGTMTKHALGTDGVEIGMDGAMQKGERNDGEDRCV